MKSVPLQTEALPPIVLIVDRNEAMLASYTAEFESAGLWVATSTNPVEAIEAVHELRPDLVVTDAFEDAEFDLVAALKADSKTRVPVILLAERPEGEETVAPIADIRLQKPVATRVLLDSSQRLIARSRHMQQGNGPTPQPPPKLVLTTPEVASPKLPPTMRRCPKCGRPLEWIEHGRLNGVEYDYYRWCATGCGLYCYECHAETWIKLT